MAITKAGRKKLEEPDTITQIEQFAIRGVAAQNSVDEILGADVRVRTYGTGEPGLDVLPGVLEEARAALRYLDRERATVLREIADLCSRLGVAAETRDLL